MKAKGLWDETVLFVTTDNGAPTPSCGGAQGGQNCAKLFDAVCLTVLWLTPRQMRRPAEGWEMFRLGGRPAWHGIRALRAAPSSGARYAQDQL